MIKKKLFLIVFVLLISTTCYAEIDGLFGVNISAPFPVEPKIPADSISDYPMTIFHVPVPNDSEIKQFYDFKVSLSQLTGVVASIEAKKAYLSPQTCNEEADKIIEVLDKRYPLNKDNNNYYRYGDTNVRAASVTCKLGPGDPYIVLEIKIVDFIEIKKIERHMFESSS